ncbi:hypothetical protein D3C81_1914920 [compost metagenome]
MVNGKEYVLTLNDQDMDVLQTALLELPYRVVAPLIAKIQAQLSAPKDPDDAAASGVTE